jgi:hypothetical protein
MSPAPVGPLDTPTIPRLLLSWEGCPEHNPLRCMPRRYKGRRPSRRSRSRADRLARRELRPVPAAA